MGVIEKSENAVKTKSIDSEHARAYICEMLAELGDLAKNTGLPDVANLLKIAHEAVKIGRPIR